MQRSQPRMAECQTSRVAMRAPVRWPPRKPRRSVQISALAAAATLPGPIWAGHAQVDIACIARASAQPVARSEQHVARIEWRAAWPSGAQGPHWRLYAAACGAHLSMCDLGIAASGAIHGL